MDLGISISSVVSVEGEGSQTPTRIFMSVDLPAPLGPNKPTTSPSLMVRQISRSTCCLPMNLCKCCIRIAISFIRIVGKGNRCMDNVGYEWL